MHLPPAAIRSHPEHLVRWTCRTVLPDATRRMTVVVWHPEQSIAAFSDPARGAAGIVDAMAGSAFLTCRWKYGEPGPAKTVDPAARRMAAVSARAAVLMDGWMASIS